MTGKKLNLPDTASVAHPGPDGRLFAPSASRNFQPIRSVLAKILPPKGTALEIASGTGQHVSALARDFPGIIWCPSDIDPDRLASIEAWMAVDHPENLHTPIRLDAAQAGWAKQQPKYDVVLMVNLLHLVPQGDAQIMISEIATALRPGGLAAIYGPFKRGDRFASDGDAQFHQSLVQQVPDIGYKSYQDVQAWQSAAGLTVEDPIEMPANNLFLMARKPTEA